MRLRRLTPVVFTSWALSAQAQGSDARLIRGIVVDTAGNALPYVNVGLGSSRRITSDSGRFTLRTSRDAMKLLLLRIGFEPTEVRIAAGGDTTVRIAMTPLPVQLAKVQVLGEAMSSKLELRGFYERMRDVDRGINRGYFVTPEDLERRKPNFITQMFDGYPSIRVDRTRGEHFAVIQGTGKCRMTVYLDGMRIIGKPNSRGEDPVNWMVKPNEIAGAEIYPRGVGAPPQYQELNGSCGIVVIWTK